MEIQFLGGASYVGSLGMMLKAQEPLLFDYGFLPMNPPRFPMEAPPVDHVFLTHCHVDHSGMIPWLTKKYDCMTYATPLTMEVSELLLEDSIKIARLEGYPQPYKKGDLRRTMERFSPLEFGSSIEVGGYEIKVHSAGHIPGAAMYEIIGHDTTLFTGDLHTLNTQLVNGAHWVKCDNLVIESTYAGRVHPERLKLEYELVRKIREVLSRGGKAILPAFAVGRTQEIMLILRGQKFDVRLDGMGSSVNRIYLKWPQYIRSLKKLKDAMNKVDVIKKPGDRRRINSDVIITTSGMLDGGPIIEYLQMLKDDSRNAVILTGYQVEGTNGRKLMDEGQLSIYGSDEKVKAEVEFFDFSAHAGHDELIRFIDGCDPKRIVLMHGDDRKTLAKDLEGREVLMPMEGEWLEI